MLHIAICDDEPEFLKDMSNVIKRQNPFGGNYSIFLFHSGEELLSADRSSKQQFDLVFLDIQMPNIDGISTAKFLRSQGNTAVLIFLTAVSVPSTETFKVSPFRYLVKPITAQMLSEELPEIYEEVTQRHQVLLVKSGDQLHEIRVASILYLTISHKSVDIVTDKGIYNTKEKMELLEQKLFSLGFVHSHKSYLINLNRISSLQRFKVTMENGSEIPISQPKAVSFRKAFTDYAERKIGLLK